MMIAEGLHLSEAGMTEICRRYRVKELAIFGSAARGQMRPESDLDLLVEFEPDADLSLLEHFAAEREFSTLFGRKVDLVSKRALRDAVKDEILSEARLIHAA